MADRRLQLFADSGMALSTTFHLMALQAVSRAEVNKPTTNLHIFTEADGTRFCSLNAIEAVILAATTLEAGINEIAVWHRLMSLGPIPADFDDFRIREKWQVLPRAVALRSFEEGRKPWQDFDCLIGLRDCLIHFKWTQQAPKKVMRHLAASKLAMQKMESNWSAAALTNLTARWAVSTVSQMFAALAKMIGRENDTTFSWGDPCAFRAWDPSVDLPCPAVHATPLRSMRADAAKPK